MESFTPRRVNYSIVKHSNDKLLIRDEYDNNNPTMTITNGVEEVLYRLYHESNWLSCLNFPRLFYEDTEGEIDEILYDKNTGEFIDFKFGGFNEDELFN